MADSNVQLEEVYKRVPFSQLIGTLYNREITLNLWYNNWHYREKKRKNEINYFDMSKCGAQMEVNPELEAIICNYCGNKMLIDREVVEQKITGGFEFGYQQEQGRLKAQQEEQQKESVKKKKKQERMKFYIRGKKRGDYSLIW